MQIVQKVAKALLWVLSWTRAQYCLTVDRPTLEVDTTDPLIAYCHRIQWEMIPWRFETDYYVLHDLDVEEKWEPSESDHTVH